MFMSYCPKCGTKVSEEMAFCPKCGAPLKAEKPPTEVGGLILIFLGLMFYLQVTGFLGWGILWAFFFVIVGIIIIIGAVYAARRHPRS